MLKIELDHARGEMRAAQTAHNVGANQAATEIAGLKLRVVGLIRRLIAADASVSASERLEAAGVQDEEG